MLPGMHDISIEEYHASEGISRSGIMLFKKSPYHYWNEYVRASRVEKTSTPAQIFGNALHTYILEPHLFHHNFFVCPKIDKRTKKGAEQWADIQDKHGHKQIISEDSFSDILAMSAAVLDNKTANGLITAAKYEKSIFWEDPNTGVLCKCRPDILHSNMVCDLKTTVDASPHDFQRSVYNYGYHIQAAMMQEGIYHATGKTIDDFIFIAIEKSPPYATAIYILDKEAIEMGREDFKRTLKDYALCLKNDEWQSYQVKTISLPAYAYI